MSKKSEKKQIYQKPKLEKYGNISRITMGSGPVGGDFNSLSSG